MSNQGWHGTRPRNGVMPSPFSPPPPAGEDPPAQVVAPASTSESVASGGSPANKTFGAFTDADGLIASYQSVVEQINGTVTATGTGLGPYTYSNVDDGDTFVHMLLAKDSGGNVLATAVHGVRVAAPSSGAAWQEVVDIDFTAADTLSAINTGTLSVTTGSGATALCSIVVDPDSSASHTVGVTNGSGVVCAGPSGTGRVTAAVNLDALLSVTAADLLGSIYCVQMVCSGIAHTSTGASVRWAISEGTDAVDSVPTDGCRSVRATSTTANIQTLSNGVTETWVSGVPTPTSAVVTMYLIGGCAVASRVDLDTATVPTVQISDIADGTARRSAINAAVSGTGMRYDGSTLYALASVGGVADVVIERLIVSRYA